MNKPEIVLCAPVRTPIGTFGGALTDTPATGLCRVVDPKTEFSRKGTGVPQTGRTCAASA